MTDDSSFTQAGVPSDALLARWLVNECTSDEHAALSAWTAEDGANAEWLSRTRQILEPLVAPVPVDMPAALGRLRQAVAASEGTVPRDPALRDTALRDGTSAPPRPARRPIAVRQNTSRALRRWTIAAGCAIAVVLLAVAVSSVRRASTNGAGSDTTADVAFRDYATTNGQRATIRLDDGTEVLLNVASRLRVPLDFARGTRTVHLEGEAQFTVTHDAKRPFVVHAGGAVIRDLATVFGVRAYPGSTATQVVVADGRVAVHAESAPRPNGAVLSAGQVARIAMTGEMHVGTEPRIDDVLGWTRGRLVFHRTPMRDALTQLSRWYDVEFDVQDGALLQSTLTTTVDDQPLTDRTLHELAYMFDAQITRSGRVIRISASRHP